MRVAQEGGSIGSGCLRQCTLQQDPIISNRSRSGSITSKVGTGESSKLDHTELLGGTILHHTIRQEQNTVNSIASHRNGILLDSPTGSWQASRGSAEHVALDNQGNDSQARVAPGRQGASALACRGAMCSSRAQVSRRAGTHQASIQVILV